MSIKIKRNNLMKTSKTNYISPNDVTNYFIFFVVALSMYLILIGEYREFLNKIWNDLPATRKTNIHRFPFFAIFAFMILNGVIASLLSNYLGQVKYIKLHPTFIEIRTAFLHKIPKLKITEVSITEKDKKFLQIAFNKRKYTYPIYHPDEDTVNKIKDYFYLQKPDRITQDDKEMTVTKTYKVKNMGQ